MAQFNQVINGKYGVSTYQETKNTYDWIMKAINSENYSELNISEEFLFDIGKIGCSCNNFKEFVENAYEQENYSLTSMRLYLFLDNDESIHISVSSWGEVRVSAGNKTLLGKMVEKLETTSLTSNEIDNSGSIVYIENQNNGVVIQGDKNRVSYTKDVNNPQISKWRQFLNTIMQNLVSNWIWYLLTIVATAAITLWTQKGNAP